MRFHQRPQFLPFQGGLAASSELADDMLDEMLEA
jgi:hypothetical protein